MGQRGPQPKPAALRLIEGGRVRESSNLADGLNPPVEIPPMPRELSKSARAEWRRIAPALRDLGLVSRLDRAALVSWCRVAGLIEDLEALRSAKIDKHLVDGLPYLEAVERVEFEVLPSGYRQQSALASRLRSLREEQLKLADRFGLSPSARARVTPSTATQLGLPGLEDAVSDKLALLNRIRR